MPTDTITVVNAAPATLLVPGGSGPTLVFNNGPNELWVGDTNTIQSTDGQGIIPVTAGSTFAVDGKNDLFGTIVPEQPTVVFTIAGGLNYFVPVTSITLPTGATSGERIVLNGLNATITGYNADNSVAYILTPLGMFGYQG